MLAWCLGRAAAGRGHRGHHPRGAVSVHDELLGLGVGPVTWVVTSEIFPLHVRSKGVAFSMALNRLTSGSVAGVCCRSSPRWARGRPSTHVRLLSAAHFAFTFFMLPETKGKSLEEIEAALGAVSARQYERVPEQREEA